MSYDLMVFDPEVAPKERDAFIHWYRDQTDWKRGHDYNDPNGTTPALRAWFMEMIATFPPMDGLFQRTEQLPDESVITGYSIGPLSIYADFNWSNAEEAYAQVFGLAGKHALGFYNVSSKYGEIWLPEGAGTLVMSSRATRK